MMNSAKRKVLKGKSTPPDPRSPKEVWDKQHRLAAEQPIQWLVVADNLMGAFFDLLAADELADKENRPRRIQRVAYMLAGFAFENLLKGILIIDESPLDEQGRFTLGSHDLLGLCATAGIELGDGERDLLERTQEFSTWAGRYPIPLDSDSLRPRPTADGGFAPRTAHFQGQDWPAIKAMFRRLREVFVLSRAT